jgi:hypothetical protein
MELFPPTPPHTPQHVLDLTSMEAKLKRAEEHMHAIENEIRAWADSNPYRTVRETNAQFTRHGVILRVVNEPSIERWSLMLGDCVHNMRSALDHFIHAIATYERHPGAPTEKEMKSLMFIVKATPNDFKLGFWHIGPLSAAVRLVIESVQPYKRPHAVLPPLLSVLTALDDSDKHRLLPLAIAQPTGGEFHNITNLTPGQPMAFFAHQGPVKDGTEIAALVFDRPSPNVRYERYVMNLVIAVRHNVGPAGSDRTQVVHLLNILQSEIREVINIIRSAIV